MRKFNLKGIIAPIMVLIAVFGLNQTLNAQMHRPILEDVFTLYNLLHRDYSQAEEPEVKQKRIEEDRATVIAIMRNYVGNAGDEEFCKKMYPEDSLVNIKKIAENIANNYPKAGLTIGYIGKLSLTKANYCEAQNKLSRFRSKLLELNGQLVKSMIPIADFTTVGGIGKTIKLANDEVEKATLVIDNQLQALRQLVDASALKALLDTFQYQSKVALKGSKDTVVVNGPFYNTLLASICKKFQNKPSWFSTAGKKDQGGNPTNSQYLISGPEITLSGQKAAFGLPGIASSAPMVVDVINEVLMEEIKAELANSVFKILKEQFATEKISDSTISDQLEHTAKIASKIILDTRSQLEFGTNKAKKHIRGWEIDVNRGTHIAVKEGEISMKLANKDSSLRMGSKFKITEQSTFIISPGSIVEIEKEFVIKSDSSQLEIGVEKGTVFKLKAGKVKLLKSIIGTSAQILAKLFPKTNKLIAEIASQDLTRVIDMLKESIRCDLKDIMNNLAQLDDIPWINEKKQSNPKVAIAFAGLNLMNQLSTIKHPVEVFSILPESEAFKAVKDSVKNENINSVARLMELFAYSLVLEQNGSRAWVSLEALEPFLDQEDFYRLYFGLLLGLDNKFEPYNIRWHEKIIKPKLKETDPDTFVVDSNTRIIRRLAVQVDSNLQKKEFNHIRSVFYKISLAANFANEQVSSIKQTKAKGEMVGYEKVISYSNSVSSIIDTTVWAIKTMITEILPDSLVPNGVEKITENVGSATSAMRDATEIYAAMSQKQYVLAVGNAMSFLQTISCLDSNDTRMCEILSNGDWTRTANLLVSIAVAENREDLESAFQQFAHNPGSWRVKRESKCNIALSVYGGGFAGIERFTKGLITTVTTFPDSTTTYNTATIGKNKSKLVTGITLSVGPSFSISHPTKKSGHSLTFYVPIIDIGAVTMFRWSDEKSSDLPEFAWKDVFAPGAFLYWGLPNVPISIGGGCQYSPALREVKTAGNGALVSTFSTSFRYGLGIAVDLNLIDFHTSLRSRKSK
jgi:hypothetical protein